MSSEAALVSAADKVHNASSIIKDYRVIGEEIWQRFQGKKEGTLWYYRALTNAFRQREVTPIVEELTQVVQQLESLS
jgi:hypothetical protein